MAAAVTQKEQEHDAAQAKEPRQAKKWAAAVPVKIFTQEMLQKLHPSK